MKVAHALIALLAISAMTSVPVVEAQGESILGSMFKACAEYAKDKALCKLNKTLTAAANGSTTNSTTKQALAGLAAGALGLVTPSAPLPPPAAPAPAPKPAPAPAPKPAAVPDKASSAGAVGVSAAAVVAGALGAAVLLAA